MSTIAELANGIGKVYRTEPDGITLLGTVNNTPEEIALIKQEASSRGPVSGEILATGKIQITSAASGSISNADVNGINQLGAIGVIITVGNPTQTSIDLAAAINLSPPTSGPRYTAQSVGDSVTLTIAPGNGDDSNGHVVSVTATGTSTFVTTNIDGGADGSETVDALSGIRYFLNATAGTAGAVEGEITGSTEITEFLIIRGTQSNVLIELLTIAAGTITPTRKGNFTLIPVLNESAAATDDLDFIDPLGFQIGDEINIVGDKLAQVVTVRDKSVSGGNIRVANQQTFSTADKEASISLVLSIDDSGKTVWAEKGRAPAQILSGDSLFDAGLPVPFGHRQESVIAGGSTINVKVDKPLDKTHLELITSGLIVLSGNTSIQFTGAPKDGQRVEVAYNGTATLGAFSITIFGIALTAQEALVGGVLITAIRDNANSVWEFHKFYDHQKAGLIQTVNIQDDAITEPKIGTDAVTPTQIQANAVTTPKVLDGAITDPKIGLAAVVLDKLAITLKDSTDSLAVSFETDELGEYRFYPGFKCNLTKVISRVRSDLAGASDGTIQAANGNGNMANGLVTHLANAAFGDEQEVNPTTNQDVDPGGVNDHFKFTTVKANAGGKTNLILFITRVN